MAKLQMTTFKVALGPSSRFGRPTTRRQASPATPGRKVLFFQIHVVNTYLLTFRMRRTGCRSRRLQQEFGALRVVRAAVVDAGLADLSNFVVPELVGMRLLKYVGVFPCERDGQSLTTFQETIALGQM